MSLTAHRTLFLQTTGKSNMMLLTLLAATCSISFGTVTLDDVAKAHASSFPDFRGAADDDVSLVQGTVLHSARPTGVIASSDGQALSSPTRKAATHGAGSVAAWKATAPAFPFDIARSLARWLEEARPAQKRGQAFQIIWLSAIGMGVLGTLTCGYLLVVFALIGVTVVWEVARYRRSNLFYVLFPSWGQVKIPAGQLLLLRPRMQTKDEPEDGVFERENQPENNAAGVAGPAPAAELLPLAPPVQATEASIPAAT